MRKRDEVRFPIARNAIARDKGVLLEDLTWQEAEKVLNLETIVVIPIGAASKEHGPHLRLKNDWLLAEYFKREILKCAEVVIAPFAQRCLWAAPTPADAEHGYC